MGKINLAATLEKVKEITLATGRMQKENLRRKNLGIQTKSTGIDLVTEIDKKSERTIIEFIKKNFPNHGILAEESGTLSSQSDYRWVIDPLDGTTNYSQGLPIFAVSIALQYKGETVLGVVYAAGVDHLFTAVKGQGAYLNGEKIRVSAKTELQESVLATGFPYDIASNPVNNLAYFNEIVLKARGVRRMGAAAYDLACVASGNFDGFWELNLSLWDVAAAALMVEEAGGRVVPFRDDRGVSIIAGNAVMCEKIYSELKRIDQEKGQF